MDVYISDITGKIYSLSNRSKILFATLTCDILYPHYVAFQNQTNWGNDRPLLKGIGLLYKYVINSNSFFPNDIKQLISEIERVTPDTEDFENPLTSFALNACTAVINSLQFLVDQDTKSVINVVTYARDTVDLFIYLKNDLDNVETTETSIYNDPYMIRERTRQFELINILKINDWEELPLHYIEKLSRQEEIIDISILN